MRNVFLAAVLWGIASSANSAVIQYSFNGSVTNDVNSQINLAETFTLSFLVDTSSSGMAINDYIQYDIVSGTIDFSGSYSGAFGGGALKITNNAILGPLAGYDVISLFTFPFYDVSGMPDNFGSDFNNVDFAIWDSSGNALSDSSIPTSLSAVDWDGSDGNILWYPTLRHNDLQGSLSYVGSPVPVPAAVWLFGSALGLLGWLRRKAT